MINVQKVRSAVKDIRELDEKGDHEKAHAKEDKLTAQVLDAIANGHRAPATLAKEVMKGLNDTPRRWYA